MDDGIYLFLRSPSVSDSKSSAAADCEVTYIYGIPYTYNVYTIYICTYIHIYVPEVYLYWICIPLLHATYATKLIKEVPNQEFIISRVYHLFLAYMDQQSTDTKANKGAVQPSSDKKSSKGKSRYCINISSEYKYFIH